MKSRTVNIGTKPLALVVAYSEISPSLNGDREGEIPITALRNGRIYTSEESRTLSSRWNESELALAIEDAAKQLTEAGIFPINAIDFPDGRYEKLTTDKKDSLLDYFKKRSNSTVRA